MLERRGLVVVPDGVPGTWLVFHVNNPLEIENGGWPDYYDGADLIEMVEDYFLALPDGDCPYHPLLAEVESPAVECSVNGDEGTGMKHAYDRSDASKAVLSIKEWLISRPSAKPMCPVCQQPMHLYGAHGLETNARFDHDDGFKCLIPTPVASFSKMAALPRDPSNASQAKAFVFSHLNLVYDVCRTMCPGLLWKEFLPLIEEASKNSIWDLKGFDPIYAPYLLLCGAEVFPKGTHRSSDVHFVLEPNTHGPGDWNNHASKAKRYLWRIENAKVDLIEIKRDVLEPWYRAKARALLGQ